MMYPESRCSQLKQTCYLLYRLSLTGKWLMGVPDGSSFSRTDRTFLCRVADFLTRNTCTRKESEVMKYKALLDNMRRWQINICIPGWWPPHPWWLFEQYATGLLFTDRQQKPHWVGLTQPVQHAHPPSQGVVPRVPFTPHPATVGGLQVNTTHLTLQPGSMTGRERERETEENTYAICWWKWSPTWKSHYKYCWRTSDLTEYKTRQYKLMEI